MINILLLVVGKLVLWLSNTLNLGSGSTWPGHIAMETNSKFVKQILSKNPNLKVVLVAGTNGKTTTCLLLEKILSKQGLKVFRNEAGANLLNGIASTLIKNSSIFGNINADVAIFEVDERNVSPTLKEIKPFVILLLNIFRDQLDRYGEVNQIIDSWEKALLKIDHHMVLFTNGDDPQLTYLAKTTKLNSVFFGVNKLSMKDKKTGYDSDFTYCPKCHKKLIYHKVAFSHLGIFECLNCEFKRETISEVPRITYPLLGLYNEYNTNAAALVANQAFGVSKDTINEALKEFKPAFGRQEELTYKNKKIIILLSKNPAGFNQSIDVVNSFDDKSTLLLVLNDRIPDGRDVSWIWDVDFEKVKTSNIYITGDRAYEMALRIKYSDISQENDVDLKIFTNLEQAIDEACKNTPKDKTLFILPTYSAMLETRKILTGKKIL